VRDVRPDDLPVVPRRGRAVLPGLRPDPSPGEGRGRTTDPALAPDRAYL